MANPKREQIRGREMARQFEAAFAAKEPAIGNQELRRLLEEAVGLLKQAPGSDEPEHRCDGFALAQLGRDDGCLRRGDTWCWAHRVEALVAECAELDVGRGA